ncbi:class I SAM-dependent methyltransferase [Rothia kristinae]|uniref:class I SAM-dependent methyltransferase n=1 Tax=Rothia kristinae TaxID=37923 RepID=UPI0011A7CEC0|nr:class I SAM-dependent methyltransferase [Rothia kristinae]
MTPPESTGTHPARDRGGAGPSAAARAPWILAQLGKRVLRPGGLETTRWLLDQLAVEGREVVEILPGQGLGTRAILAEEPAGYTGVEPDEEAHRMIADLLPEESRYRVVIGRAERTGLTSASVDAVLIEVVLSMLGDEEKSAVLAEAHRILRPGGVCGVHELALRPGQLSALEQDGIRRNLARELRLPARPLTVPDWEDLAQSQGLRPEQMKLVPMSMLQPRRMLADEGAAGVLRILGNMARRPRAARRAQRMHRVFWDHRRHLSGMALVLRRPR